MRSALKILGLDKKRKTQNKFDSIEIEKLIKDRDEARKNKDFQKADFIRDELKKMMVEIRDSIIKKKFKELKKKYLKHHGKYKKN